MSRICPQCNSEIDAAAKLCPVCLFGEGLKADTIACTGCHAELEDGVRFCSQCGAIVPAAAAGSGDPIRTALAAKLESQYRIVRLLGQGGMGSVYLARDLTLEREVAIKVVRTAGDSREIYDRFRREAKTAAKLSHPNIVPLHAFGEVEGMPYFVMGYVRGESLADRLRREGRLPEDDARRVFSEIASALDHAHRQGIVHRDVKPDNVLLDDESGRALLTDFGVARAVDKGETLTRHGSVVGTPHYMSPEQASGRSDIDGRSDIYSLGVMAYAMLAGRLPFEGKSAADILAKHLTQAHAPLRSVAPNASDATVQAVERCLVKDPAARWPDARSLELALGTTEEGPLPENLRAVEGYGAPALLLTLVVGSLLVGGFVAGREADKLFLIAIVNAVALSAAYLFMLARLRIAGHSFRQSQRAFWTEPSWWPAWYPRRLRRAGNVWERLPASARAMRWWFAFLALASYLMPVAIITGRFDVKPGKPLFQGLTDIAVGCAALIALWLVLNVRARNDLRRKGLAGEDAQRVAFAVPPSRISFWARPHIAAILAPAERPGTERRAESPHDLMQSILRQADELSGPLRPLGAQAAVAARQLVASIDLADREIADLARNIEPGEEGRLVDKIEALASPTAGAESEPMRTLLEKQLELIRALSARIEEAKEKRNRRVQMLTTLALHVASLRARLRQTPTELRQISDNVRTLCDDIGRQAMELDRTVEREAGDDAIATIERR